MPSGSAPPPKSPDKMTSKGFQWAVVGAGPAGIAAVGKLLDAGVASSRVCWVDPHFDVGLLGRKWSTVSSNTTVELFDKFLRASDAFQYGSAPVRFPMHDLPPNGTCELRYVVEPLMWITNRLREQVTPFTEFVSKFERHDDDSDWCLTTESGNSIPPCRNVVLATGSRPKMLNVGFDDIPVIPLDDALQIDKLSNLTTSDDTVGVFGSSHSAIMIVRDLLEVGVAKVINFYRSDVIYAEPHLSGGFVNDSTGLKGRTAEWARRYLTSGPENLPARLERHRSTMDAIAKHVLRCDKLIYAVGFDRAPLNIVDGGKVVVGDYDPTTGRIAPHLFGAGIAFPELGPDVVGKLEMQVGLWKFMRYLTRIVPDWVANDSLR